MSLSGQAGGWLSGRAATDREVLRADETGRVSPALLETLQPLSIALSLALLRLAVLSRRSVLAEAEAMSEAMRRRRVDKAKDKATDKAEATP
jgi:hypothetical protein